MVSLKGYWTPERDNKLIELVNRFRGNLNWNQLSEVFPGVKGRFLKDRWVNHLDPSIKKQPWSWKEDQILKKCYLRYRNNWAEITKFLEGRTVNQIRGRLRSQSFKDLFPSAFKERPRQRRRPSPPREPTIGEDI